MTDSDFEVCPSGTHKILDDHQVRMESAKANLRMIMDAYPASTMAYALAEDALKTLEANKTEEV